MKSLQHIAVLSLALAGLALAGCSQRTINSAQKDTEHNVAVVNKKADELAKQAKPELNKLDLGARVTAAIAANENLRGTAIRVDASPNGVTLRGSVKTAAQKTLADQVARNTLGPGKTVTDELQVKA
jgi:osmotically-inducible protein OsmY